MPLHCSLIARCASGFFMYRTASRPKARSAQRMPTQRILAETSLRVSIEQILTYLSTNPDSSQSACQASTGIGAAPISRRALITISVDAGLIQHTSFMPT